MWNAVRSCLRQLKARIDDRIDTDAAADKQASGRMFVRRVWQVAAAVLLPVLILTTIYFYRESRVTASGLMVVSTGAREKAQIVLSDGTRVVLNADSKLSYAPHLYNKDARRIEFEGEGYFEVSKDPERPFSWPNPRILALASGHIDARQREYVGLNRLQSSILICKT